MDCLIKNFELRHDGMFHITWTEDDKIHQWYVDLVLSEFLRIVEIEGLTIADVIAAERNFKPLIFNKAILKYELVDGLFNTWGFYDKEYENTIVKNPYIELFVGDSLKNYRGKTLVGSVVICDELDLEQN